MSRSPEINQDLEHKKRTFAAHGVLFDTGPRGGRLSVSVERAGRSFPVTAWFKGETGWGVLNFSHPTGSLVLDDRSQVIAIDLEEIHTAEQLVMYLTHEMAHVVLCHLEQHKSQRDEVVYEIPKLAPDSAQDLQRFRDIASSYAEFIEQEEREAWEWALKFLMRLRQKHGWDIRTVSGFSKEQMKADITVSYLSHRDHITERLLTELKRLSPKTFESHQAELVQMVREKFNPKFLEFMIDQFWES